MPTPSNYLINFTDTGKVAISISGGQKDGPGFINHSTSLVLIGQFAPLYGEDVNENFLHLLENFSYLNAPLNPVVGQLWHKQDETYDVASLSPSTPYPGDFNFRVWTEVDNTLGKFSTSSFWSLPRIVLIDDNIANRTALVPMPGDLWLDTAPNSVNIAKTSSSYIGNPERVWDFAELKIFDPNTDKFESIGRNYIKINDNATQTINSKLIITKNTDINQKLTVTGLTTLNNNLIVDGTLYIGSTTVLNDDVLLNNDLIISGTLQVDQTSLFKNNINIINNSSLTSNGDATFININGTTVALSNTLLVNGIATFNEDVFLNKQVTIGNTLGNTTTNLVVIGSQTINGDLSISGVGYGNLNVDNNILAANITSTTLTISDSSIFNGNITAQIIDLQNLYKIINCIDPSSNQDVATKNYIDSNYLRRDDVIGSVANNMDAVLVLSNINQNTSSNNASTVGYVDHKDSFNVKKAGDTIALLNITGNLSVGGTSSFTGNIQAGTITNTLSVTDDISVTTSLSFLSPGKLFNVNNGYITGVIMQPSPGNLDVPNYGYVNTELNVLHNTSTKINPSLPKNGDVRVDTSPTRIYVYANGWVQVFPAQYA